MLRGRSIVSVVAALVSIGGLSACLNTSNPRDTARFCASLRAQQPLLTSTADRAALVARYQELDKHAPLQIMDDWHRLTVLIERATTYDPMDTTDTQNVIIEALQAQNAMAAVAVWSKRECKLDLGAVPTTVPIGGTGDQLLSTTTTKP